MAQKKQQQKTEKQQQKTTLFSENGTRKNKELRPVTAFEW